MKRLALIFMAVFALATAVGAKDKNDSIRILFIGNSYTYVNDLPQMVAKISREVGPDERLPLACSMRAPGGWSLKDHAGSDDTRKAIESRRWDYVVLQDQSAAPSKPTAVVAQGSYPYARKLDSLIHKSSPKARVIFYMTWGHKFGTQEPLADYPLVDTYEGMQMRLATSYLEMTYQNNAWCAPVGLVWREVRSERPYLQLNDRDASHPSPAGTYLAANVFYSVLLGRPYQCLFDGGLGSETAEYIQQKAQSFVATQLRLLNIKRP